MSKLENENRGWVVDEKRPQLALLTKAEVAAFAQCTTRCIDNWMRLGYLPYFKIGRTVRFKASDVEAYLNENFRVARRTRSPQVETVGSKAPLKGNTAAKKLVQDVGTTEVWSFSTTSAGSEAGTMANHFCASDSSTNSK